MPKIVFKIFLSCLILSLLMSCSDGEEDLQRKLRHQPAAKPAVKEAQYDTGRTAFQQMFLCGAPMGARCCSLSACNRNLRRCSDR